MGVRPSFRVILREMRSITRASVSHNHFLAILGILVVVCLWPFIITLSSLHHHQYQRSTRSSRGLRRISSSPIQYAASSYTNKDNKLLDLVSSSLSSSSFSGNRSRKDIKHAQRNAIILKKDDDTMHQNLVSERDENPIYIYMDWMLPSDSFSILNFKSLESVLTHYPNARVRILVLAPQRVMHYKCANLLPFTMFEKYVKRGYDVQIELTHKQTRIKRSGLFFKTYQKTLDSFCGTRNFAAMEDGLQDAKIYHFLRLAKLWQTGGLYIPFTILLLRPFAHKKRVFWTQASCFGKQHAHLRSYASDYAMRFKAQNPILTCMLTTFDDASHHLHQCLETSHVGGTDCIQQQLQECADALLPASDLLPYDPVAWFDCSSQVTSTNFNDQVHGPLLYSTIESTKPSAIWTGHEATNGRWHLPKANSALEQFIQRHVYLDRYHPLQIDPQCAVQCHYFADATKAKGAGDLQHPGSLNEIEASAAQYICSPSIFVAGAFKAASSALFTAIAKHPQVLHPLRGSNYKETGLYMNIPGKDRFRDRVYGFPFIEPHENFLSADGTVYYLSLEASPLQIVADSPNAHAIISLREPVARAFSQYRYSFNDAMEPFAEAVRDSIPIMDRCFDQFLYDVDLWKVMEEGKGFELAHEVDKCTYPLMFTAARQAIRGSLYVFQVMRWAALLGRDKVLVITQEQLRDGDLVMDKVFEFLGLCPFDYELQTENVRAMEVPDGFGMTDDSLHLLHRAFQPWNRLLHELLGENLGYTMKPVASLGVGQVEEI